MNKWNGFHRRREAEMRVPFPESTKKSFNNEWKSVQQITRLPSHQEWILYRIDADFIQKAIFCVHPGTLFQVRLRLQGFGLKWKTEVVQKWMDVLRIWGTYPKPEVCEEEKRRGVEETINDSRNWGSRCLGSMIVFLYKKCTLFYDGGVTELVVFLGGPHWRP